MVNITDKVSTNQTNIAANTSSISTNIPASLGTASQVLAVNSGATATEWVDAAGGSTTKISTTTVSTSVASVGITLPTSGYTYLLLHVQGFQPAISGYDVQFRLSDDGGTSFEPIYWQRGQLSTTSWTGNQSSGTTMVLNQSGISNSANAEFRGFIRFNIPTVNSTTSFDCRMDYNLTSNQNAVYVSTGNLVGTGVTANFCLFQMSGGNINNGVFTLYGIS